MLIDKYCPIYITRSEYAIEVNASIEKVYPVVHSLNISHSKITRLLLRLRGFPADLHTFDGLKHIGFIILGDEPFKEITFGLIGKFWTYPANIQKLSIENFNDFYREGFAKAVANITFKPLNKHKTLVQTETRVFCFDKQSTFYFRLYWALIAPFSGLIRKGWLKTIKREAEKTYLVGGK